MERTDSMLLSEFCAWCGTSSTPLKLCGGCKRFAVCSKECQLQHWKAGGHKAGCKGSGLASLDEVRAAPVTQLPAMLREYGAAWADLTLEISSRMMLPMRPHDRLALAEAGIAATAVRLFDALQGDADGPLACITILLPLVSQGSSARHVLEAGGAAAAVRLLPHQRMVVDDPTANSTASDRTRNTSRISKALSVALSTFVGLAQHCGEPGEQACVITSDGLCPLTQTVMALLHYPKDRAITFPALLLLRNLAAGSTASKRAVCRNHGVAAVVGAINHNTDAENVKNATAVLCELHVAGDATCNAAMAAAGGDTLLAKMRRTDARLDGAIKMQQQMRGLSLD